MSFPREDAVECPRCGVAQDVRVWASINVTTDPDLKRAVLDGSLTRFECGSCGHHTGLEYDLLYHDMGKRLAVWLKYPDEEGVFGLEPPVTAMGGLLGENYVRRIVPSHEELVEKVRIADAGLDDFEVELIKLLACIREGIDLTAPFLFTELRRTLLKRPSIVFVQSETDGAPEKVYSLSRLRETIPGIVERLKRLPPDNPWPYLNRHYVLKRLSDAGMMTRVR